MRIQGTQPLKSAFLSVEKDMTIITKKILENKRLQRLLYYTDKDPTCLEKEEVSPEMAVKLFGRNIKITPKMHVDKEVLNYIFISFDNFVPNDTNPQYRNNQIAFDIICHNDQWQLKDFQLRPYRIAAEIDTMFNNQKLTGIGTLQFLGAANINVNDEFSGITIFYAAIHGDEDKNSYLAQSTEQEQKAFDEAFEKRFGNILEEDSKE